MAEPDRFRTGDPRREGAELVSAVHQRAGKECRSGRCQGDRAAVPVEQAAHPEVAFQRLDLLGQGRPDDQEPARSAAEIQLLGDREEIPQLAQSHEAMVRVLRERACQRGTRPPGSTRMPCVLHTMEANFWRIRAVGSAVA